MNEGMSADQIEKVFGALARIEQKIDGHVGTVKAHMDHDEKIQKALFERIETLQLTQARQKGAAKVWSMVSSGIGAAVGAITAYLGSHH